MVFRSKASRVTLFVFTGLFLTLSVALIILLCVFDRLYLYILFRNLALSPSSPIYADWIKPSVPIYFSVYLFNVTNTQAILKDERPFLQEVGPFVYRETRERFDVKFSNESRPTRVQFKHRIFYHFMEELSIGHPADFNITTPDLYYLAVREKGLSWFMPYASPFITITAEQVMWGYYPYSLSWFISAGLVRDRKVGLFSDQNGTRVNRFLMDTGAENIFDIGRLYEVDGAKKLSVWDHDEANMINGTDGSLASPGLGVGSTVTFHVPEICRSSTMYAVGKTTTVNDKDVEVIVFSAKSPNETDPLVRWRGNMFCQSHDSCPPKGLVSLAPCLAARGDSLPLFLSLPYFLDSDPSIRAPLDGLPEPNHRDHSTWLHIEPTTGFVLEAFKRVQFNVYLEDVGPRGGSVKGPYYFPLGWLAETAVADAASLAMLRNRALIPRATIPVFITAAIVLFLFAFLVCFLLIVFCARTGRCYPSKRSRSVCPSEIVPSLDKTPVTLVRCDMDGLQTSEVSCLLGFSGKPSAPDIRVV